MMKTLTTVFLLSAIAVVGRAADIDVATVAGDLAKVQALLSASPTEVGATNAAGDTPLHLAARLSQLGIAGFTLQSAPSLDGTFTNLPGGLSPHINAATSSQMFFRLKAN